MNMGKKVAALAVAMAMTFSLSALVACGQDNEKLIRDGVTEELEGVKALNDETMSALTDSSGVAQMAEYGISAEDFLRSYLSGFDYSLGDVVVDGDKATVEVTLTCKDFAEYQTKLEEAAAALAADGSVDMSNVNEKIGEIVMGTLDQVQASQTDPITLEYELVDNTWTPTDESMQAVATAMFS